MGQALQTGIYERESKEKKGRRREEKLYFESTGILAVEKKAAHVNVRYGLKSALSLFCLSSPASQCHVEGIYNM